MMELMSFLQALPLMLLILTTVSGAPAEIEIGEGDLCAADKLEQCIKEGHKFIRNYVKKELEQRGKKRFDKCKTYGKFHDCITPLINNCPTMQHDKLRHHWLPLIRTMDGACDIQNAPRDKKTDLKCLTEEYDSVLSYQCDEYYKFNIEQKTRHICHFANERVHCREALVSSSCTPETGEFLFHLLKLDTERSLAEEAISCNLIHNKNYSGLRYDTTSCTTDLVDKIDTCSNRYLIGDHVVDFREESDIIVSKDGRKNLKDACSALRSYNQCLQPIRQNCPQGAKVIFEYAEPLKKYLIKMDYICQDHILEGYLKNIKCMNKEVIDESKLSECDSLWQDLHKVKEDVTSYKFYCDSKHHKVQDLMTELDRLQTCYSRVFETTCTGTGDIVKNLLKKVFEDPLYLRFSFKPDCALHQRPDTMSDAAAPGSDNPIIISAPGGSEPSTFRSTTPKPLPTSTATPRVTTLRQKRTHKPRVKDKDKDKDSVSKKKEDPTNSRAVLNSATNPDSSTLLLTSVTLFCVLLTTRK